jgi:hypothetical protein
MNTVIVGVLVVLAASTCSAKAQQQTQRLPTATEVFNLRSKRRAGRSHTRRNHHRDSAH